MLFDLSNNLLLPILFATGLVAGTVDAIAGGGGLISLPILLGCGMPPQLALGTNKLQSSIGTFMATLSFYRKGLFSLKKAYIGLIFGFAGAALGSIVSQMLSNDILKKIIPILLLIMLLYTIFAPKNMSSDNPPKMKEIYFYSLFGFSLSFYDGFFGPGTGSFWVVLLIFFLGYNLTKATAYTKLFNLNSNIVAVACFALGHNIDYRIGLCMAAGQLIGGRLGAHLAIKNGAKLIKPVFIMVVGATITTLVYKNYAGAYSMNALLLLLSVTALIILIAGILWSKLSTQKSS